MAYRQTKRRRAIMARCAAMRAAKARKRLAENAEDRLPPFVPPLVRRVIEITDYDFGESRVYRMELRRSRRIDCYDVYVDGMLWQRRMGWSRILAVLRKALPRLSAALVVANTQNSEEQAT